jgi:hypothetical protein
MELGFETIGSATLICHDNRPVRVTDPWIVGSAYFGSWTLSHDIPPQQMEAIRACEYICGSHGHPDHINADSLARNENFSSRSISAIASTLISASRTPKFTSSWTASGKNCPRHGLRGLPN